MMSPTETMTWACGILMCIIGICTFVSGIVNRAKGDGVLSNKVDNALKGIEDIKTSLSEQRTWRDATNKALTEHSEQIKTLFNKVNSLEDTLRD
jgi:peptidoglycan hydrolase CwlO-like protein